MDLLSKKLGLDTRITTLGHTQRGGVPCAFDRMLATVQGVEAVNAVLDSTPETPSPMIGMRENKITRIPLVDAVKLVPPPPSNCSPDDRHMKSPKRSVGKISVVQWNFVTLSSRNTLTPINAPPSPTQTSTLPSPKTNNSASQSCTSVPPQEE